ncbi:MAG: Asp-tRNA(Asn)/Glu-tRNA(Gln) amidotransferase subunit GatB [Eubacteriales bacterium]|nr:Asp-tRNA(Asn)/Glu-tRNA(Gln) amidotransferase subunit GatB [Eubacteriales bacterium]
MKYDLVCGLETHVELSSKSKIFCGCTTEFGGEPNTHCCPVCLGHPGTLPVLNREVVNLAVMAGLALNCKIQNFSKMDRKNYSYPDLPKAYQISQFDMPLCKDGFLTLSSGKRIRIERIHIEEDAGKLVHTEKGILIDCNRAGVPLIEIVTKPDISSIDEAKEYVTKLQQIMRYIGVSDCKMQEGSMRCDVNISVKPHGESVPGIRTEIKNMNSVSNMAKAMEYEYKRQCALIEKGEKVTQETLRFNDAEGTTSSMRSKEDADDYRFFPEPDLVNIVLTDAEINGIRANLPELPQSRVKRYTEELGLSTEEALHLTKYRNISDYFERALKGTQSAKLLANFIIGQIFATFKTEGEKEAFSPLTTPSQLCDLVKLLEDKKINKNLAKITLDKMLKSGNPCTEYLSDEDMSVVEESTLRAFCREAAEENTKAAQDYRNGKEKALMAILGTVMKKSKGKADGEKALEIIKEILG